VDGLNEPGDAEGGIGAKFEGVAEFIILPAENDIDLLESAEGFQKDAIVADGEVAAFDEGVSKIAREVGVFKIGFVVGAGGEENDAGIVLVLRGEGFEGIAHGAEEGGDALDAAIAENVGESAGDDETIFEGVAGAGGSLGAIGDDPELTVGRAGDVGGVDVKPAVAGEVGVMNGAQKAGMSEDEFGRDESVAEKFLRAVDIGEEDIEEAGALGEAGFETGPFDGIEEEGDGVKVPGAVHAGGIAVDVIGDTVVVNELARGFPAALEFLRAEVVEEIEEHQPVRPDGAVGFLHFVEKAWGRNVGFAEAGGMSRPCERVGSWGEERVHELRDLDEGILKRYRLGPGGSTVELLI